MTEAGAPAFDDADGHRNRGDALLRLKRFDEAVASYDKAVSLKPDYAEAFGNRGAALKALGRLDEAVASYDRAIALRPGYAAAHSNRGNALRALGRLDEAVASYDEAVALKPEYAAAYLNRGLVLQDLKRFEDAIASYDKAIALQPDDAEAHNNRGVALKRLKRSSEALASFDKVIMLKPDAPEAHGNRGNALQELGRFTDAVASYDAAIALKPDHAEAYNNRGVALWELKRLDEAIASHDQALALKPGYAEARWNRALACLLTGRFDEGWRDYEARKARKEPVGARHYAQPLWLGDAEISGKTILVHWEQGFGDTIQFCRYLPTLGKAGARLLFAPQLQLKTLMRTLATTVEIVDADDPGLQFDFHCPLLSLPLAFKTDLATIPRANAYLGVDHGKVGAWSRRLGERLKPRVGVAWSGNVEPDLNRSIDLHIFRRVFDERCQFISLQKEVKETDRGWLANENIAHFGDALHDFSDTAALCHLMDLVISVDTGVAHLAGALGKRAWVLLPWVADWRWLLDGDDSPWYPSMRLFRQQARGDWDGVLRRVKAGFEALF